MLRVAENQYHSRFTQSHSHIYFNLVYFILSIYLFVPCKSANRQKVGKTWCNLSSWRDALYKPIKIGNKKGHILRNKYAATFPNCIGFSRSEIFENSEPRTLGLTWYRCPQHRPQQDWNMFAVLITEWEGLRRGEGDPGRLAWPLYGTSSSTNSRSWRKKKFK
jgi:hypothetical protein